MAKELRIPWVTIDQWVGFARWGLTFILGFGAGKGWFSVGNVESAWDTFLQIVAPLGAAGTGFWTYIANGRKSILKAVVKDPRIDQVVVNDATIKDDVASEKVVNGK